MSLEDRIALLDEMLSAARVDMSSRARVLEQQSVRPMSITEVGFAVALDVYDQWKAIALPKVHADQPIDMPREEGTNCV